jgi:monooxygenase
MLVLVNDFRVHGDASAFEVAFATTSDYFERQPGFIRHTLVRSTTEADRYINIAEWEGRGSFDQAVRNPMFADHAKALRALATSEPKLCEEVLTKVAG